MGLPEIDSGGDKGASLIYTCPFKIRGHVDSQISFTNARRCLSGGYGQLVMHEVHRPICQGLLNPKTLFMTCLLDGEVYEVTTVFTGRLQAIPCRARSAALLSISIRLARLTRRQKRFAHLYVSIYFKWTRRIPRRIRES
jgi:hypothetical protein